MPPGSPARWASSKERSGTASSSRRSSPLCGGGKAVNASFASFCGAISRSIHRAREPNPAIGKGKTMSSPSDAEVIGRSLGEPEAFGLITCGTIASTRPSTPRATAGVSSSGCARCRSPSGADGPARTDDPAARHRPAGVGSPRAAPDRAGRSALLHSHPRTPRSRAASLSRRPAGSRPKRRPPGCRPLSRAMSSFRSAIWRSCARKTGR